MGVFLAWLSLLLGTPPEHLSVCMNSGLTLGALGGQRGMCGTKPAVPVRQETATWGRIILLTSPLGLSLEIGAPKQIVRIAFFNKYAYEA